MTRALIAARKSTKAEGGVEGVSLHTQDQRARDFCERMGWEVAGAARDTISGRVAPIDRKELGAWLADPTGFDVVVAYRTDRLSRGDQEDWTRIEHWATEHGKVLCIVDSGTGMRYPARDDSDYWQWQATKREAGREWENMRERAMRSMEALQAAGSFATNPPWAYRIVGSYKARRLEVREDRRATIEQVFRMAIDGSSLWQIARATGLPNDRFVRRVILNWAYAGRLERNGVHYMDCPPIVDAATLVRAQAAMRSRNRKPQGGRPSLEPALLIPRCAEHDKPMYRSGPNATTYRCPHHFTIMRDRVDRAVLRIVHDSSEPERRLVVMPGRDHADEIERAKRDRRQALERDDLDAVTSLTVELKRLQALPVEPAKTEWKPTGRTVGEAMAELPRDELRKALKNWLVEINPNGHVVVTSPWGVDWAVLGRK